MTGEQAAYVCDSLVRASNLVQDLKAERFSASAEETALELEALLVAIGQRVATLGGGLPVVLAELNLIRKRREALAARLVQEPEVRAP